MDSWISCAKCCQRVSPDAGGKLPPWCRHCGADLKDAGTPTRPDAQAPAMPANADITDRPTPTPAVDSFASTGSREAPLFFHAYEPSLGGGSNDLFRVYVTDCDLLVFKLGPGSVSHGQVVPQTKARRFYGAGGFVGGGIVGAVAAMREAERLRQAAWVRDLLDTADEETLRDSALARQGGYVLCPDDLVGEIRIDPPSFWNRLICGADQEGVLRFHHRREGRKTLALPAVKDVRSAAEAMTRLFGDEAQIHLPWAAGVGQRR